MPLDLPENDPIVHLSLFQKLLDLIQRLWRVRFIRFLFVGALNTLFGYVIYALLVLIGLHYSLATLISTILGIIFNFFTTGRIVFKNRDNKLIIAFVLVYAFTYGVNVLLLRWLIDGLGVNKLVAGAIVTLPVAVLSYLLNSIFTFKTIKLFGKSKFKDPINPSGDGIG